MGKGQSGLNTPLGRSRDWISLDLADLKALGEGLTSFAAVLATFLRWKIALLKMSAQWPLTLGIKNQWDRLGRMKERILSKLGWMQILILVLSLFCTLWLRKSYFPSLPFKHVLTPEQSLIFKNG